MKIDSGIKKPESQTATAKAIMSVMNVGDSFLDEQSKNARTSSLYVRFRGLSKEMGMKFSASSTTDGCRIWRVA
jgi:hypothetical protein